MKNAFRFSILFGGLLLLFSSVFAQKQTIKILYTADEHGWFMPSEYNSGASALFAEWQARDDFSKENYLILSGGDNWTGTALSTWSYGKPMAQIMGMMGYRASATGNHEFDFGTDTLTARLTDTGFPYLAANVTYKKDGSIPSFLKPYLITNYKGLKIGLLGLANTETPTTTMPENVEKLQFTGYAQAVDRYVPEMKQNGAELIIIVSHLCSDEALALAPTAKKHNIPLITAGHCHLEQFSMKDNVLIVETGAYMSYYSFIELEYDKKTGNSKAIRFERMPNQGKSHNKQIDSLAQIWNLRAEKSLRNPIGYTGERIPINSPQMENFICDSWLEMIPEADLSFSNTGGIRQDIFKGQITQETMMGLLPFSNKLIKIRLTGKQIKEVVLSDEQICIGGFTLADEAKFLNGTPIEDNTRYTVVTNDYLYMIKENLQAFDSQPEETKYSYRSAVTQYLKKIKCSAQNPLENFLDYERRLP